MRPALTSEFKSSTQTSTSEFKSSTQTYPKPFAAGNGCCMATRNPRLRDLDIARVMLESGRSYRAVGMVLAGHHVHHTTHQLVAAALAKLGLQPPPSAAPSTPKAA